MIEEEYDRLAWGLVKEEIRNLTRPRDTPNLGNLVGNILKPGIKDTPKTAGYYQDGTLSVKQLAAIQQTIHSAIETKLCPFNQFDIRAKMGPEYGYMDAHTYQFWHLINRRITCQITGEARSENMLDLFQLTANVTKKKLIADLTHCFVIVNQHVLYRMVQRGHVAREPLRDLSQNMMEWLPHACHFLWSFASMPDQVGENFLIPYGDGALLCEIGTSQRRKFQGVSSERLRFQDGVNKTWACEPPFRPTLEHLNTDDTYYALKISTWVPDEYFSPAQHWAKEQMLKLAQRFKGLLESLTWIIMPHYTLVTKKAFDREEATSTVQDYRKLFQEITSDPRWRYATKTQ